MNQTTADLKPADAVALTLGRQDARAAAALSAADAAGPADRHLAAVLAVRVRLDPGRDRQASAASRLARSLYVVLFGIGSMVMRGAGCTYQRHRRSRHRRRGRAHARPARFPPARSRCRDAWLFLIAQCLVGLAILLQLNGFAIVLGAASLLLVAAYPFMKRITWWPQAWLGLTFNWGALLGFAAQTGLLDVADGMLYAGLFFWTLGYDTIYALQDKEDDALIGVKSTALLFGARRTRLDPGLLRRSRSP